MVKYDRYVHILHMWSNMTVTYIYCICGRIRPLRTYAAYMVEYDRYVRIVHMYKCTSKSYTCAYISPYRSSFVHAFRTYSTAGYMDFMYHTARYEYIVHMEFTTGYMH